MIDRIQISVVIPARNRAKTLPACLDSVVRQTYPAVEVIVVNDGSTDETEQIVREHPDPRIRYTQFKTSHGAQAARNCGVELAKSEWIAFQDSDDIWLPEKLAVQVETLARHNFDKRVVIHGDGIRQDEQSGVEELIQAPLTTGDCYHQLLLQAGPMFPSLLVSRWAILEAGGLDNDCPSYQEWDTAIRLSRICRFVHVRSRYSSGNGMQGRRSARISYAICADLTTLFASTERKSSRYTATVLGDGSRSAISLAHSLLGSGTKPKL